MNEVLVTRREALVERPTNRDLTDRRPRHGISLIEILISIFVLLFGLMGVAAIFPVGNHYVTEGEKFDLGGSVSHNAFDQLTARGMLQPEFWHYADPLGDLASYTPTVNDFGPPPEYETSFIQPDLLLGTPNASAGLFNIPIPPTTAIGPGHSFVIDPLGTAAGSNLNDLDIFPYDDTSGSVDTTNPWNTGVPLTIFGTRWPVRRLTVLDATGLMGGEVAGTIFRMRDELVVELPDQDDQPAIQNWDIDTLDPEDPDDDLLLTRQYNSSYSWLATVVPTSAAALTALQPRADENTYGELRYDVSVVVFHKRDATPSADSERQIRAEFAFGNELVLYGADALSLDDALDEIGSGNWIAITGVDQSTGVFLMKWYRIVSLDQDSIPEVNPDTGFINHEIQTESGNFWLRRVTLAGPDWPEHSPLSLRAIVLPGTISAFTQQFKMEGNSLWKVD